jgi:hypothetical protein
VHVRTPETKIAGVKPEVRDERRKKFEINGRSPPLRPWSRKVRDSRAAPNNVAELMCLGSIVTNMSVAWRVRNRKVLHGG